GPASRSVPRARSKAKETKGGRRMRPSYHGITPARLAPRRLRTSPAQLRAVGGADRAREIVAAALLGVEHAGDAELDGGAEVDAGAHGAGGAERAAPAPVLLLDALAVDRHAEVAGLAGDHQLRLAGDRVDAARVVGVA